MDLGVQGKVDLLQTGRRTCRGSDASVGATVHDLNSVLPGIANFLSTVLTPVSLYVVLLAVFAFISLAPGRVGRRALAVLRLLTRKRPDPPG